MCPYSTLLALTKTVVSNLKKQNRNRKPNRLKKKNISGKKPFLILFLICLSLLTYGIYSGYSEKTELKEVPESTIGTINKKYSITSRGYYINYTYKVNSENYGGTEKLNKDELEVVNLGDKFKVTYSRENPKYSQISFDNRIEK
jgi:hypothetical protein